MEKTIIRRIVTERGSIHLPTSCIGKRVGVEYVKNGLTYSTERLVKGLAHGGYIYISKEVAGRTVKVDLSNIFSVEALLQRRANGEHLTRTEQNILLDAWLYNNHNSTMGQRGQIPG